MKLILVCLAVVLVLNTVAEEKVTLCGEQLARARVLLCFGEKYLIKRRAPSEHDVEEDMISERRFWNGRNGVGVRWERNKRGLVDECCYTPCYPEEIRNYC